MCVPRLRTCSTCGWKRVWFWEPCRTYLEAQIEACATGTRCHPHKECDIHKSHKSYHIKWPLKVPALQCGNPDCPELAKRDDALRTLEAAKQQRERGREEMTQMMVKRQVRIDAKRQKFARKYFRKRPVPRFEEPLGDGDLEEPASEIDNEGREVEGGKDGEIESGIMRRSEVETRSILY